MTNRSIEDIKRETGITVKNAMLVVQLGLVYDAEKHSGLNTELWHTAEKAGLEKMPLLKVKDLFFQKDMKKDGEAIWYSFRYYTPKSNIV